MEIGSARFSDEPARSSSSRVPGGGRPARIRGRCRDADVDCEFETRGASLDEVMQLRADHGAAEHGMKGFGPELYAKMRRCVKTIET